MKHINLSSWRGSITDWTKLNYIKGGLDDYYADIANIKGNYVYIENGVYKIEQNYNKVDMGSLNWSYITDGNYPIFISQTIADSITGTFNVEPNATMGSYEVMPSRSGTQFKSNDYNLKFTIRTSQKDYMVQDNRYTDEVSFKTAMSGVYLTYEIATPTIIPVP